MNKSPTWAPFKVRPSWALIEIYRQLLARIEESGYDVMSRRIRLSTLEKMSIVVRAALRRY
jgi:15-cis-phytoene synthase